jgi:hypothetical protein
MVCLAVPGVTVCDVAEAGEHSHVASDSSCLIEFSHRIEWVFPALGVCTLIMRAPADLHATAENAVHEQT